jgi:hypothetical protein
MSRPWRVRAPGILLVALLTGACGDAAQPDPGGVWVGTITGSGAQSAGAAVVALTGPGIEAATALDSRAYTHAAGDTVRVVLVRDTPGMLRFSIRLARGSTLPHATVLELADGANELVTPATPFAVSFTR